MSASRIGVVGAGTMGAGIAGLAAQSGFEAVLCDADPKSLRVGSERARSVVASALERGRLGAEQAEQAIRRIVPAGDLDALAACELVIEAVPERLSLKREVLARVAEASPGAVLASNTSSISIASLAEDSSDPTSLVGLHFFNPPERMKLVELVRGPATAAPALALARGVAEAMGKVVIEVADGPGFLVNRCARPYYLEALRLVEDGLATAPEIDRICRLAGFPMGPFELMDLVGIDVGLAVTRAMWEQSYGEPRWRPSPLQVQMVAAGRLGRKSGAGFRQPGDEPALPAPGREVPASVAIEGRDALAKELRRRALRVGIRLGVGEGSPPELRVCTEAPPAEPDGVPLALACADAGPRARSERGAVGFQCLAPLGQPPLVELAAGPWTAPGAAGRGGAFFAAIGFDLAWVGDGPGLVLGRIVAQLVNEAAHAVAAGIATASEVDRAMEVALGHPRGPRAWGEAIGLPRVVALLDALRAEDGDPRYRVAAQLRRDALEAAGD